MNISRRNSLFLNISIGLLYVGAIYRYGLRIIIALLLLFISSFLFEKLCQTILKNKKRFFNTSVVLIFPLILPPSLPFYMIIISLLFGLLVATVFFGGEGKEVISPIALSWGFAALSFQDNFNLSWNNPAGEQGAYFFKYILGNTLHEHPIEYLKLVNTDLNSLLSGVYPGTLGMGFPIMLVILGIVLFLFKVTDYKTALSFLLSFFIFTLIKNNFDLGSTVKTLFTGNFIIVTFLILPYKPLCAKTSKGAIITAIISALSLFLIRNFSSHVDGALFAVLIYNIFNPVIDDGVCRAYA